MDSIYMRMIAGESSQGAGGAASAPSKNTYLN